MLGITVSPPFSEIVLNNTDSTGNFDIKVTNSTQTDVNFKLKVVDFGSLDEAGGVAFMGLSKNDVEQKYSLASWISLEKDWITIASGKTQEVKGKILNRESLSSGGHYGAIIFRSDDQEKNSDDRVQLDQTFASLLYVQKTGGEKYDLKINRWEWKNDWWGMPNQVSVRYQNSGNIHTVPRGKVVILGGENEVAKGIINGDSSLVLPESFRIFKMPILLESKFIWPGKYRIEVQSRYDGKDSFEVKKTSFFYFGWEGMLLTMVFLAILGVGVFFVWKNRE